MKYGSFLLLSLLSFTSCATITRGVHEKLRVESDPPQANVQLSTGETGITPATFVKKRRTDNFSVTISKAGYVTETVKVESKFSGTGATAMAGNLILGGAIGMGVDAGTGAYHSLYPNPVSVRLVPRKKSGTTRESGTRRSQPSTPSRSPTPVRQPGQENKPQQP